MTLTDPTVERSTIMNQELMKEEQNLYTADQEIQ